MKLRAALALVGLVACGSDKAPTPERREAPTRRVIEPPHGDVRALPPHAITAEGVGPFKLSMAMSEIAASLPPGSRMSLLQIPGVVDHSVVRDAGGVRAADGRSLRRDPRRPGGARRVPDRGAQRR